MTLERVFVTGAGGFVGAHLARALAARGASTSGCGLEAGPREAVFDRWRTLDVSNAGALADALADARPDAVVHLAGQSSAARSFADPQGTFRANVLGTWGVLEAVRAAAPKARVLVVGSGEVYGPQDPDTRAAEDSAFRPVSPYALSKAVADELACEYARHHGLDVVRTRSFGHTGPGQAPTFVIPSFAQQIAAIERGGCEPVLKVGNLDVVRDLSDVRDVVAAYVALLERGRAGEAYNVGAGRGVKLSDAVASLAALARVAVRVEVDSERFRPADVPYLVGDTSKLERETGWRATHRTDDTLRDVLEEWRGRAT